MALTLAAGVDHPSNVPLIGSAHYSETFAAAFSATDLTARSGCPNHAAQIVEVYNAGAATANAVVVDINGKTLTQPVAPLGRYSFPVPIITLSASTDDNISATAYWWAARGHSINA